MNLSQKSLLANLGVGAGFQILGIPAYACGLKPGSAYILNQNPVFEIGSSCSKAMPSRTNLPCGRIAGTFLNGRSSFFSHQVSIVAHNDPDVGVVTRL